MWSIYLRIREALAEGVKNPAFTQEHIIYYRRKMAYMLETLDNFSDAQFNWLRSERDKHLGRLITYLQREHGFVESH